VVRQRLFLLWVGLAIAVMVGASPVWAGPEVKIFQGQEKPDLVAGGNRRWTPKITINQMLMQHAGLGDVDEVKQDLARGAKVIGLLVQNGAKVNAADCTGYTLLMIAAVNNKPDLLKLALALGADPRLQNREGLTALEYARSLKFAEIEAMLRAATAPQEKNP
jgi:hypothetical protein